MQNLSDIIRCYKRNKSKGFERYLTFYKKQNTLADAIEKAACARYWNNKKQSENRHPHQRLISENVLRKVKKNLMPLQRKIKRCRDFIGLKQIVDNAAVKKFGALAVYDTVLRIGAHLGIRPKKIYLHCGSLKGAKIFFSNLIKDKHLELCPFPRKLKALGAMHIENLLCICKDCIKKDRIIAKRQEKCRNKKVY